MTTGRTKKVVATSAIALASFGAGIALAVNGSASATTDAVSSGLSRAAAPLDPSRSVNPDEHLLSGTTAQQVRDAALAKYPNATIQRVETDSEGVYEAHIVTAGGEELIVQVGKDFSVTGTQAFGGGEHGHGGPGDLDGDGPTAPQGPTT